MFFEGRFRLEILRQICEFATPRDPFRVVFGNGGRVRLKYELKDKISMRRKRNPSPALQPIEPKTRISDGGKDYSRNPFSKYLWPYSQLDSP